MAAPTAALDRERWRRLWCRATGQAGDATFDRVAGSYAEPHRFYHNATHIIACIQWLDTVAGPAADPVALELAIWFHDAVYDPRRLDNEERSAAFASEAIRSDGGAPDVADDVAALIQSTMRHAPAAHPDGGRLLDIDLAILGQPLEVFAEYEHAIAREYAWVPEEEFRARRAGILAGFLARPQIYLTPAFASRFERTARVNLAWSLQRLSHGEEP